MKQASLFDGYASLAGAIPAIKAAMREAAKAPGCDGRKALPDMMNELAVLAGVKLTKGNAAAFGKATLDKMLSPSDSSHPPSILARPYPASLWDLAMATFRTMESDMMHPVTARGLIMFA